MPFVRPDRGAIIWPIGPAAASGTPTPQLVTGTVVIRKRLGGTVMITRHYLTPVAIRPLVANANGLEQAE